MDFLSSLKQKLDYLVEAPLFIKLSKVFGAVALLFIVVNLLVYGVFWHRTFPNTTIGKYSLGATSYSLVSKKIANLSLLPKSISLHGQGKDFSISPTELGISVDSSQIASNAHKKSWLPVSNLFVSHHLQTKFKVNQPVLKSKLGQIAAVDQQPASDAQIALQNNQFTLINSKNGYQLDSSQAIKLVSSEVTGGKTTVTLPFSVVKPKVSEASLEPMLQQLRAQQGVSLTYTYNGQSTKVPAATIAGWFAEVNGQFQIQPDRVQAYINQVGASNGIHVKNLSDLVSQTKTTIQKATSANLALVAVPTTVCSPNGLNQLIIVSISQRHMWACNTYNLSYDAPVVTGIETLPADLTPTGTYKITSKQTGLFLNGSDSTGSWHEFVNYWMPFLTNQYGTYGFHDATWRSDSDFGNIDPSSSNASHGCVEMPLAAAKWLYGWASRGTTVTIAL